MGKKLCAILTAVFAWMWVLLLCPDVLWAATEGGSRPVMQGEGTEVQAGVVVDYMGKLRFVVKEEGSGLPIPGASVELLIPFLNNGEGAYVLIGVTNEQGIYELDLAFDTSGQINEFENIDGVLTFSGSMLYLKDRSLQWRVYKAGWQPYPKTGTTEVYARDIPQIIEVLLYRTFPGGGGGSGGRRSSTGSGGGPGLTTLEDGDVPLDGMDNIFLDDTPVPLWGLPKTGVETYARYWAMGLALLLAAAGFTAVLLIREGKERERAE